MAEFRSVQTRMWREDPWFQDLPIDARLFWIYLFTNPSASICGMYRLTVKTMAAESGLTVDRVTELLTRFSQDGKAFYENGTVWIFRMRENQLGRHISKNQLTGIENDLAKVPACPLKDRYLIHYGYPIDTLSIPVKTPSEIPDTLSIPPATHTGTVTDTHTGTVTGTGKKSAAGKTRPHDPNLDHPAVELYREIIRLTPNGEQRQAIVDTVTDLGRYEDILRRWMREGFRPQSVEKQLGVYRDGWHDRGNGKGPPEPHENPGIAAIRIVQERERQAAEEAARHGNTA